MSEVTQSLPLVVLPTLDSHLAQFELVPRCDGHYLQLVLNKVLKTLKTHDDALRTVLTDRNAGAVARTEGVEAHVQQLDLRVEEAKRAAQAAQAIKTEVLELRDELIAHKTQSGATLRDLAARMEPIEVATRETKAQCRELQGSIKGLQEEMRAVDVEQRLQANERLIRREVLRLEEELHNFAEAQEEQLRKQQPRMSDYKRELSLLEDRLQSLHNGIEGDRSHQSLQWRDMQERLELLEASLRAHPRADASESVTTDLVLPRANPALLADFRGRVDSELHSLDEKLTRLATSLERKHTSLLQDTTQKFLAANEALEELKHSVEGLDTRQAEHHQLIRDAFDMLKRQSDDWREGGSVRVRVEEAKPRRPAEAVAPPAMSQEAAEELTRQLNAKILEVDRSAADRLKREIERVDERLRPLQSGLQGLEGQLQDCTRQQAEAFRARHADAEKTVKELSELAERLQRAVQREAERVDGRLQPALDELANLGRRLAECQRAQLDFKTELDHRLAERRTWATPEQVVALETLLHSEMENAGSRQESFEQRLRQQNQRIGENEEGVARCSMQLSVVEAGLSATESRMDERLGASVGAMELKVQQLTASLLDETRRAQHTANEAAQQLARLLAREAENSAVVGTVKSVVGQLEEIRGGQQQLQSRIQTVELAQPPFDKRLGMLERTVQQDLRALEEKLRNESARLSKELDPTVLVTQLRSDIADLHGRVGALAIEDQRLAQRLETQLSAVDASFEKRIGDASYEVTTQVRGLLETKVDAATFATFVDRSRHDQEAAEKELRSLGSRLEQADQLARDQARQSKQQIQQLGEALREQLDRLTKTARTDVSDAEERIRRELREAIARTDSQLGESTTGLNELRRWRGDLEELVRNLERRLGSAQSGNGTPAPQVSSLEIAIADIRTRHTSLSDSVTELQRQLTGSLNALRAELSDRATRDMAATTQRADELAADHQQLRSTVQRLELGSAELKNFARSIAELTERFNAATTKLQATDSDLLADIRALRERIDTVTQQASGTEARLTDALRSAQQQIGDSLEALAARSEASSAAKCDAAEQRVLIRIEDLSTECRSAVQEQRLQMQQLTTSTQNSEREIQRVSERLETAIASSLGGAQRDARELEKRIDALQQQAFNSTQELKRAVGDVSNTVHALQLRVDASHEETAAASSAMSAALREVSSRLDPLELLGREVKTQIRDVTGSIRSLQEDLRTHETQQMGLGTRVGEVTEIAKTNRGDLQRLDAQIREARRGHGTLAEFNDRLVAQLAETGSQVQAAVLHLGNIDGRLTSTEQRVLDLHETRAAALVDLQSQVQSLTSQARGLQDALDRLAAKQQHDAENVELQLQQHRESSAADVERRLQQTNVAIRELRVKLESLDSSLREIKTATQLAIEGWQKQEEARFEEISLRVESLGRDCREVRTALQRVDAAAADATKGTQEVREAHVRTEEVVGALKGQLQQAVGELGSLRKRVDEMSSQLGKEDSRAEAWNDRLIQLKSNVAQIGGEMKEFRSSLAALSRKAEMDNSADPGRRQESSNVAVEQQLTSITLQLQATRGKVDSLEAALREARQGLSASLDESIGQLRLQQQESLQLVGQRIDGIAVETRGIRQAIERADTAQHETSVTLQTLQQSVVALGEATERGQASNAAAQGDIAQLKGATQTLTNRLQSLDSRIEELHNNHGRFTTELRSQESAQAAAIGDLRTRMENAFGKLEERLDGIADTADHRHTSLSQDVSQKFATLSATVKGLNGSVAALEVRQTDQASQQSEAIDQVKRLVEERVDALRSRLEQTFTDAKALRASINKMEVISAQLADQQRDATQNVQRLTEQAMETRATVITITNELQQLRTKLEASVSRLPALEARLSEVAERAAGVATESKAAVTECLTQLAQIRQAAERQEKKQQQTDARAAEEKRQLKKQNDEFWAEIKLRLEKKDAQSEHNLEEARRATQQQLDGIAADVKGRMEGVAQKIAQVDSKFLDHGRQYRQLEEQLTRRLAECASLDIVDENRQQLTKYAQGLVEEIRAAFGKRFDRLADAEQQLQQATVDQRTRLEIALKQFSDADGQLQRDVQQCATKLEAQGQDFGAVLVEVRRGLADCFESLRSLQQNPQFASAVEVTELRTFVEGVDAQLRSAVDDLRASKAGAADASHKQILQEMQQQLQQQLQDMARSVQEAHSGVQQQVQQQIRDLNAQIEELLRNLQEQLRLLERNVREVDVRGTVQRLDTQVREVVEGEAQIRRDSAGLLSRVEAQTTEVNRLVRDVNGTLLTLQQHMSQLDLADANLFHELGLHQQQLTGLRHNVELLEQRDVTLEKHLVIIDQAVRLRDAPLPIPPPPIAETDLYALEVRVAELPEGLTVTAMREHGIAAQGGIRHGDRIVAIDDRPVLTFREIDDLVQRWHEESRHSITVVREGRPLHLTVQALGRRERSNSKGGKRPDSPPKVLNQGTNYLAHSWR